MELYDFLVYPALLYTRAEIARAQGRMEKRAVCTIFLTFCRRPPRPRRSGHACPRGRPPLSVLAPLAAGEAARPLRPYHPRRMSSRSKSTPPHPARLHASRSPMCAHGLPHGARPLRSASMACGSRMRFRNARRNGLTVASWLDRLAPDVAPASTSRSGALGAAAPPAALSDRFSTAPLEPPRPALHDPAVVHRARSPAR